MKGLLREWLYNYKWWLIGSVLLSAVFAVLSPIVINAMMTDTELAAVAGALPLLVFAFCMLLPTESVCSSNTKLFENKFARFSVTAMSPEGYTACIFAKYIISTVFAAVCCAVPFISMYFGCDYEGFTDILWNDTKTIGMFLMFCAAGNAFADAITIKLKSRDKATLLLMAVAFAIGFIATAIGVANTEPGSAVVINIVDILNDCALWIYLGCAALFAAAFFLISHLIRKGELL